MYASGSGGSGPWLSFGGIPGNLSYFDGSSFNNITTVNANQWYHVKIIASVPSHTFDIYVDDMTTPVITGANFRDGASVTTLDNISFTVFNVFNPPTTEDNAYVDDVLVSTPTAVPTMSEWGMIMFMVLSGLGAVYYMKRQRRAES
jgi:acetamidase/formamidase